MTRARSSSRPSTNSLIGAYEVKWIGAQTHYKGQIAILSANATSANQNTWIKFMKAELKKPQYKNMKLVKIAYGNDDPTVSAQQAQALLQAYPEPGRHHLADDRRHPGRRAGAPAGGQVRQGAAHRARPAERHAQVRQGGLHDEVRPLEREDLGYLSAYVAHNVLAGKLNGKHRPELQGRAARQRTRWW